VPQKRQSWPLPAALQPTPGEVLQVGSTKHLFTPSHSSGQVVGLWRRAAGHAGAPPPVSQKRQSWPLPPALQPTPPEVLQVVVWETAQSCQPREGGAQEQQGLLHVAAIVDGGMPEVLQVHPDLVQVAV